MLHARPRRDARMRLLDDTFDVGPSRPTVEANTQPAAVTDVRRDEEPHRVRLDSHPLQPDRRGAPKCLAVIAVVIVPVLRELLLADEECRSAVAQAFGRPGKGQADGTDPRESAAVIPVHERWALLGSNQ